MEALLSRNQEADVISPSDCDFPLFHVHVGWKEPWKWDSLEVRAAKEARESLQALENLASEAF